MVQKENENNQDRDNDEPKKYKALSHYRIYYASSGISDLLGPLPIAQYAY